MTVKVEQVRTHGTALVGVVSALKPSFAASPEKLPGHLWRYFEETLDPLAWYPLADYLSLMKILAAGLDPAKAKGDIFRAFGVIGAQRDLRGVQENVPEEMRPITVGVYRDFMEAKLGLSAMVRRGLSLRERYYSSGYYKIKRIGERCLHVTLEDFPASAELCAVSTGYLVEVFRAVKPGAWVERLSCRGTGDSACRWELRFKDDVDVSSLSDFE